MAAAKPVSGVLRPDEWYRGVYQVLGIREEIDRDGVDVPLPSSRRHRWGAADG